MVALDTPEGVKARRNEVAIRLKAEHDFIRAMMGTTQGRLWFWDILTSCHVGATSFSSDSLVMAFSEGERNIGLRIQAQLLAACPDRYIEMLRENGEKDGRRADRDAAGGSAAGSDPADSGGDAAEPGDVEG